MRHFEDDDDEEDKDDKYAAIYHGVKKHVQTCNQKMCADYRKQQKWVKCTECSFSWVNPRDPRMKTMAAQFFQPSTGCLSCERGLLADLRR